jgi:sugar phosphate isomerase/epimerase
MRKSQVVEPVRAAAGRRRRDIFLPMAPPSSNSLSRRDLGLLAAGALVSAASPPAVAAPPRRPPPMRKTKGVVLGVQSYSFRDRPLDQAIAAMKQLGLATCELWQGHLEPRLTKPGATEADRKDHREAVARFRVDTPLTHFEEVGRKFVAAGVPLCAYNYSFRSDFTDAEIERGFLMARAMGAPAITASAQQGIVPRVAKAAAKHRMKVAMHNHSEIAPDEFATPDDFERAMDGPGRQWITVNLDIGHYTAANFDAVAFLRKHHKRILTLHIKDRKRDQGAITPFGEGDAPIKEVLALLRQERWPIPANIEYEYTAADTVAEVKRCLEYCQQALG